MAGREAASDANLRAFLRDNFEGRPEHQDAWEELILNDTKAREHLSHALEELKKKNDALKEKGKTYVPDYNVILKSVTFKPPRDIKGIIVAHDPEISREMATGLAFSFPRSHEGPELKKYLTDLGENAKTFTAPELKEYMDSSFKPSGYAMVVLKIALLRADAETVGDLNFCYEDIWAKQGVLLLNSALTVNEDDSRQSEKHDFWLDFTARLIFLVLRESRHQPVLGMFWGDFAGEVLEKIRQDNGEGTVDMANCRHYDHPTWPRDQNNYIKEAEIDFRKLYEALHVDDELTAITRDMGQIRVSSDAVQVTQQQW